MNHIFKLQLTVLLIFALNTADCQKNDFSCFEPFTQIQWVGNYANSSDSAIVHYIKWEFSLDSAYVKQTKKVPELSFNMETYYYQDYEMNQISFISLLNRDMISKGKIELKENFLEISGKSFFPEGSREFKQTFEINENDDLIDSFYRKESGKWVRGHLIYYHQARMFQD